MIMKSNRIMALAMMLVLAQFSLAATADTNIAGAAPRVAGATTVVQLHR
jgi:hypothetical protein